MAEPDGWQCAVRGKNTKIEHAYAYFYMYISIYIYICIHLRVFLITRACQDFYIQVGTYKMQNEAAKEDGWAGGLAMCPLS